MRKNTPSRATSLILCAVAVASVAGAARADVIYQSISGIPYASAFGAARLLDDVTLPPGTAPITVRSMAFGYNNFGAAEQDVDAVVTFWDNVDPSTGAASAASVNLGSFRVALGAIPGDEMGVLTQFDLPAPIVLPDNTAGVQIDFVLHGTNTLAALGALLQSDDPTVGTSGDFYWSDDLDNNGIFSGGERVDGDPPTRANMYLLISSTTAPEPGALGLGAAGLGLFLARRARRAR